MRCYSAGCVALGLGVLLLAGGASDPSAPQRPKESAADSRAEALRKQRAQIQEQIARLSTPEDADDKSDKPESPKAAATLALMRSIDAVYAQHLTRLEQLRQLEAQNKDAEKQLEALDKFDPDEPKPYSFLLLEKLKDQLEVEEDREEAITAEQKSADQLLKAAHDELDATEKSPQRSAKKSAKKADKEASRGESSAQPELAGTLARARVGLKQTEVELQNLRLKLSETTQKQLSKKIDAVKKDMVFSAADRDKQLQRMAATEAELKRRRKDAESSFEQLESERKTSLAELTDAAAGQAVLDQATEAWRVAGDAYQTEIVVLDQQIENIADIRRFWKRRYELATGKVEPDRLSRWLEDVDDFLDQLKETTLSLDNRRNAAREQQGKELGVGGGEPTNADATKWRTFENARLQELRDLSEFSLSEIKSSERSLGRFRKELKAKVEENSSVFGTSVTGTLRALMAYKVVEADEQDVTVGRLLVLLAYIAGGVVLAYALSRLIGRRLLPQFGMHRGTAAALKSIVFYTMCVIFGVMAFRLLNIPLAAFAFLGGAAAIAVGFGSQDIMNNFMSGIILLVEQPIRIGDVVEVDEVQGVVLHIGLRSTRLQTVTNHELIVPNKTLIDEEVTNLTLSDNFVQTFVAITLERNVPVQHAKLEMLRVAFSHPLVIKSPRPVVLLKEVDTYWMMFEVHFSLQYSSFMKCAAVQSEILEAITELFPPAESDSEKPTVEADEDTSVPPETPSEPETPPTVDLQKFSRAAVLKEMKRAGRTASR